MSEQWYCPNCGPVTSVEFEDGDLYTTCVECCENVEDSPPPFVLAMQQRIVDLQKICLKSAFLLNEMGSQDDALDALETIEELEILLREAGYGGGE